MKYYGYYNAPMLCGMCSWIMDGTVSVHIPQFDYRVICRNNNCANHGIVFRLPKGRIELEPVEEKPNRPPQS